MRTSLGDIALIAGVAGALYLGYTFVKGTKSAADAAGNLLNPNTYIAPVGQAVQGAGQAVQQAVQQTEGQARQAFFNTTGYDSYAPVQNILQDMAANAAKGVSPNFETITGHQIYVAPPTIASSAVPLSVPSSSYHPANGNSAHPASIVASTRTISSTPTTQARNSPTPNFSTVTGKSVYVAPTPTRTTGFTIGGIHYG